MINVALSKRIKGDKLAETVESTMKELLEFDFERGPIQKYDSNSNLVEVERSLKARKKLKWYDPLLVASGVGGGLGVLAYLVPLIGQALYVSVFLFPDILIQGVACYDSLAHVQGPAVLWLIHGNCAPFLAPGGHLKMDRIRQVDELRLLGIGVVIEACHVSSGTGIVRDLL